MKKYIDKYSIIICLIMSIVITYLLVTFICDEFNKMQLSNDVISGIGFGMSLFVFALLIGFWAVFGFIYDKLF